MRHRAAPTGPHAHTVYCFPFAAGSSRSFNTWFGGGAASAPPAWLDIVAVEIAGRGARADEPLPANDAEDAAQLDDIAAAIAEDLAENGRTMTAAGSSGKAKTFTLAGMSMGALFAVEIAERLKSTLHGGSLHRVAIIGRCALDAPARLLELLTNAWACGGK